MDATLQDRRIQACPRLAAAVEALSISKGTVCQYADLWNCALLHRSECPGCIEQARDIIWKYCDGIHGRAA